MRKNVFAAVVGLAVMGCPAEPPVPEPAFPEGFLFGAAVAGFQVDMGCPTLSPEVCEDRGSDWYAFVTSPETVGSPRANLSGDPVSAGPGHWELYDEDLERLAQEAGGNGYRFSIEWSRVFPEATDGVEGFAALKALAEPQALAHYHQILAAARARGLTPLVTLNHYTLPLWIHDAVGCHLDLDGCSPRGWLDRERTVREIAKYAGFVAEEFGGEVDQWATLNEPFAVLLPGYVFPSPERTNPPAVLMRGAEGREVLAALVEGHARMYDAVKAADIVDADGDGRSSFVGVVYPMVPVRPKDPSDPLDVEAAERVFYLWNLVYLNAVIRGELDHDLDGTGERREDLVGRMDFLGLNYYTRITVEGVADPVLPTLSPLTTFNPFTMEVWEDYPRGIYEMVRYVNGSYGLPVIVTENGVQDAADDGTGASYLVRHLSWLERALREGADVRGYFYWTLMDNYEWNHGMGWRMGLYAVDPADPAKTRIARSAVDAYRRIALARGVPEDLSSRYPID